jgi:hypothetical protein
MRFSIKWHKREGGSYREDARRFIRPGVGVPRVAVAAVLDAATAKRPTVLFKAVSCCVFGMTQACLGKSSRGKWRQKRCWLSPAVAARADVLRFPALFIPAVVVAHVAPLRLQA